MTIQKHDKLQEITYIHMETCASHVKMQNNYIHSTKSSLLSGNILLKTTIIIKILMHLHMDTSKNFNMQTLVA